MIESDLEFNGKHKHDVRPNYESGVCLFCWKKTAKICIRCFTPICIHCMDTICFGWKLTDLELMDIHLENIRREN